MDTTTYETTRGAEVAFAAERDGRPDQVPLPEKIGDDALYVAYGGNDDVLFLRTGRVLTRITYSDPDDPDAAPADRIRLLTLVAQNIAEKLDKF